MAHDHRSIMGHGCGTVDTIRINNGIVSHRADTSKMRFRERGRGGIDPVLVTVRVKIR